MSHIRFSKIWPFLGLLMNFCPLAMLNDTFSVYDFQTPCSLSSVKIWAACSSSMYHRKNCIGNRQKIQKEAVVAFSTVERRAVRIHRVRRAWIFRVFAFYLPFQSFCYTNEIISWNWSGQTIEKMREHSKQNGLEERRRKRTEELKQQHNIPGFHSCSGTLLLEL